MSTLFVEPSTSVTKAMSYLSGESHNPDVSPIRNLMFKSNYSDAMRFFVETKRRMNKANRARNQIYSIRLSFSRNEFDAKDSTDQLQALELSKQFTEALLKKKNINRPYLVALQADGRSGLLHAHIYICNPGTDGKGIPKGLSALKLQDLNDRVTKDYMIDHDRSTSVQDRLIANKQNRDHNSVLAATGNHKYARSVKNEKAFDNRRSMQFLLQQALRVAVDREDFLRRLQQRGVYINQRANSSSDDLWLTDTGTFRKSISLEYKGTKARTTTLLGMNLEQIDQQLFKNLMAKRTQKQIEKWSKLVDKNKTAPLKKRQADQQAKQQTKVTQPRSAKRPVKQQNNRPLFLRDYINQEELLNRKYQKLMAINQKLADSNLSDPVRQRLEVQHKKLVSEVADLESIVSVNQTQKSIQRLQQVQHQSNELGY